jgi:hypothetical protein
MRDEKERINIMYNFCQLGTDSVFAIDHGNPMAIYRHT